MHLTLQRPINVRFLVIRSPLALCPDSHVWCGRECPPDLCGSWVWLKGKAARAGSGVGVTAEILSTGTTGPPSFPKYVAPPLLGKQMQTMWATKAKPVRTPGRGGWKIAPRGPPCTGGGGGGGLDRGLWCQGP